LTLPSGIQPELLLDGEHEIDRQPFVHDTCTSWICFRAASRRKRVALVVLLRGVNVGGHRTFRPSALAKQLKHLGAVNIGAAGTYVIRRPVTRAQLRAELARRLPFDTEIVICQGREIVRLMSQNFFADQPVRPGLVRFVSVLSKRPRSAPSTPMSFPSSGSWLLKIVARDNRFVFGVYRRHLKVISYLGMFDRLFGVPVTTRNWNTITAMARVLGNGGARSPASREGG
jgi:uncharacterized protein (DUF1697 family)